MKKLFFLIVLIFMPLMLFSSLIELSKLGNNPGITLPVYCVASLLFCWIFLKKENDEFCISTKSFFMLFITIIVGIRFIEIFLIYTEPVSDFGQLVRGARAMLDGHFGLGLSEGGYWDRWNYQLGPTFYEYLVFKIFNTSEILILKVLNVLWSTLISVLIYGIAKSRMGESSARASMIISGLYLPYVFSVSVLTNQHLSTFFVVLSTYVLLSESCKEKCYYIVGLTLALSHLMRPIAPVFIIAMGIYVLIYTQDEIKERFKNLIRIISSFIIMITIFSVLFISLGMTNRLLFNQKMPTWKFLVGTNVESNGRIGEYERELMRRFNHEWDKDYDRFNEEAKKEIVNRLNTLGAEGVVKLSWSKFQKYWGAPDTIIHWSISSNTESMEMFYYYLSGKKIINLGLMQLAFLYLASLFSLIFVIRSRDFYRQSFFYICLSGYIAIHILVEIQTRYRYSIMPILFLMAGHGIAVTIENISEHAIRNENVSVFFKKKSIHVLISVISIMAILFGVVAMDEREELVIKAIDISAIGNHYIFTAQTSEVTNSLCAWYIYKDYKLDEVAWYSSEKSLSRVLDEGTYYVRLYVKDSEGHSEVMSSEKFIVNDNQKLLQIHSTSRKKIENGNYQFEVTVVPNDINCKFAWYIFHEGEIIEKIPYTYDSKLEYSFNESGSYKVKYFIESDSGKINGSFENIIIE